MNKTAAIAALLLTSACVAEEDMLLEDELLGEVDQELVGTNGIRLNTTSQNGIRLNGIRLNTGYLNGIRLNTPSLNGVALTGVKLSGNTFTATGVSQWKGVILEAADANGAVVKLRIDEAFYQSGKPSKYVIRNVATNEPVCGYDAGGAPTKVVPVPGLWNYGVGVTGGGSKISSTSSDVTLACSGKDAIAKCVEWGYYPWATATGYGMVSPANAHQACTRAVRQDYCGDGRSFTFDGNTIDIYDRTNGFPVNSPVVSFHNADLLYGYDGLGRGWQGETEWTPDGGWVSYVPRFGTGQSGPSVASCKNGWAQRVTEWRNTALNGTTPGVRGGTVNGVAYTPFQWQNFGKNGVAIMTHSPL